MSAIVSSPYLSVPAHQAQAQVLEPLPAPVRRRMDKSTRNTLLLILALNLLGLGLLVATGWEAWVPSWISHPPRPLAAQHY